MNSFSLYPFLQNVPAVRSLADKVSTALFVSGTTEPARYVSYSSAELPNDFVVTVLGTTFTAKLEYFKFIANSREYLAGQFYFFEMVNGEERRLETILRMLAPSDVILPDGTHMDAADLDLRTGMVTIMRDKLSTALLTEQVGKMGSWSFD